jgi:hypothetical protein
MGARDPTVQKEDQNPTASIIRRPVGVVSLKLVPLDLAAG